MAIVAPYLPYDKLRTIASDFLRVYHPAGDIPIPIERIVEFKFRLDIVPVPGLLDEFDVDAFITSDWQEIRVDQFIQAKRPARYRFSLAHELAHLLIHKDTFAAVQFSTIDEWKEVIASIPPKQYFFIEHQAYCLGGLILVPPVPLRSVFEEKVEDAAKAGIELRMIDDEAKKTVNSHIGRFFEVSGDVIKKRTNYDGLWK